MWFPLVALCGEVRFEVDADGAFFMVGHAVGVNFEWFEVSAGVAAAHGGVLPASLDVCDGGGFVGAGSSAVGAFPPDHFNAYWLFHSFVGPRGLFSLCILFCSFDIIGLLTGSLYVGMSYFSFPAPLKKKNLYHHCNYSQHRHFF